MGGGRWDGVVVRVEVVVLRNEDLRATQYFSAKKGQKIKGRPDAFLVNRCVSGMNRAP